MNADAYRATGVACNGAQGHSFLPQRSREAEVAERVNQKSEFRNWIDQRHISVLSAVRNLRD